MNWKVNTGKRRTTTEEGKKIYSPFANRLYKGHVVHTVEGVTAEASLNAMADKWNSEGYVPNMTCAHVRCLADLSKGQRDKALKEWGKGGDSFL